MRWQLTIYIHVRLDDGLVRLLYLQGQAFGILSPVQTFPRQIPVGGDRRTTRSVGHGGAWMAGSREKEAVSCRILFAYCLTQRK